MQSPPDLRKKLRSMQALGVICPSNHNKDLADLEGTVMTQMNMKRGIKTYGQAGVDAVQVKLKQLHERDVMQPIHAAELSKEQNKANLKYLMFLKNKRWGRIKGRGCANGRKQRTATNNGDASTPTV